MSLLLLTKVQAEAIYSAMCAPNNLNAEGRAHIKTTRNGFSSHINVDWEDESVLIISDDYVTQEWHDSQSAFATAYGLQTGA